MKKFSIIVILLLLTIFISYITTSRNQVKVLKVYAPNLVALDLNNNGKIEVSEQLIVNNIESFSSTKSDIQKEISDALNISEDTALSIGYFAEKYAQSLLEGKNVKYKKLKNNEIIITANGKNYNKTFQFSPFALKDGKPINNSDFQKQIKLAENAQLRIYNNKSKKYHKLSCEYGQLAHDSIILPEKQLPKETVACKVCKNLNNNTYTKGEKVDSNKKEQEQIKHIIPHKYSKTEGNIKLYLTDLSTHFKTTARCTGDFCSEIVKQINLSNSTIDIALYGYTDIKDITNAIQKAIQRGVKVRIVFDIDSKNSNFYPDTFTLGRMISESNCDKGDSQYQNAIMHNKFFIFDEKTVLTGSANISSTDISDFNSNAIILIKSPEIAEIYKQEFEQMYAGNFHNKKTTIPNKENILVDNSIVSVYFSPQDKTIVNKLIPLINNAEKYIYIPIFVITHKKMTQALINAKERGVDVRVILDATNARNTYTTHETLRKNGILVKTENFAGKMHAKSLIIDDKYLVIGSMNFSKSGESKNDENCLIIENYNLTKYYKEFFLYLWNKIPDKWLTHNAASESHDSLGSCSDGIDNDFDGNIDMADSGCIMK